MMGLFGKIKEVFSNSTNTTKEVTTEAVETVTGVTDDTVGVSKEVVEKTAEKKDNCCGGNCGS